MLGKQEHPKTFRELYLGYIPNRASTGDKLFNVGVGNLFIR